ncbi:MAG: glycine--tRNA ligase subunit beta [Porticoccaceae bacterium]
MSTDFLVEIGTEELPPKALLGLAEAFRNEIVSGLQKADLSFGEVRFYAAPRRLAVVVASLDETTPSKEVVAWGPPVKVAIDSEGLLTKAGEAFARKNGVDPAVIATMVENDGTQDKLCLRATSEGVATSTLLGNLVNAALAALPIPKRMRWGAQRDEFVRPVHWVVMLFGDTVVDAEVLSLKAGRTSRGHRFHSSGDILIQTPSSYCEDLRQAYVIADFNERRNLIEKGVRETAKSQGGTAVIDPALLDEVTALNEWPVPLAGKFEQRFLEVPPEALISSMKEHQKYFHVVDGNGALLPLFITVANIESRDPAKVVAGNEKVIRPRLSDAAFFYETDRKHSLIERREHLKTIVFQDKLGTIFDKTQRISALAAYLAETVGATRADAVRAGQLCKSDLVSAMVMEFDDLQGLMGRYYAINDGENGDVAAAMFEHYMPRFAGDQLPQTATGTVVALADRLDTLVGIFGIGQPPTGSRDPFALRRASLGILRILVEKAIDLNLSDAINKAISLHSGLTVSDGLGEQVLTYLFERFRAWYEDEGISAEVFMAVQAKNLDNPLDFHLRVQAVHSFNQLPEASALAAANKRVSNILAKNIDQVPATLNATLFEKSAEKSLVEALNEVTGRVNPLLARRSYGDAMKELAILRKPVDSFFDQVMVMAEDPAVRSNRLRLLTNLRDLFLNVADISHLVPAK